MQVFISNPIFQTQIFIGVLIVVVLATIRRKEIAGSFSKETTQELKGFAIIAILLAHIGYYLASDHRFLFPISVLAGVGVDLFLFLSGFGLTASAFAKELSLREFYKRRLKKIYVPLWVTLGIFFVLDALILHKTYGWKYVVHSFAGWFPHANLYSDINSPLWYISLIVFYYLVFPFIFTKKYPAISAGLLYALTLGIMWWNPSPISEMMGLYKYHLMAFPLGILAATLMQQRNAVANISSQYLYYPILAFLAYATYYFALNSGVGKDHWLAESISILTMFFILAFFIIKRFEIRLFSLFGIFSFEIYLLHWPILYRYDIFFRFLPASLALCAYLVFFIGLGWALQKMVAKIESKVLLI